MRDDTISFPHSDLLDDPGRAALLAELARQGVRPNVAMELLTGLAGDGPFDINSGRRAIEERMAQFCPFDASLGADDAAERIVALVGPPGCGQDIRDRKACGAIWS